MTKTTIAIFQISTEEDLRFQLDFVGLDLTGRTLKVNVRRRDTGALVQALTAPSNITLVGDGNLTVFYPRASMSAWAKTEYEADIIDETGGSATRIMAVRFVYDEPGKLVYGVRGNQATVTFAENQATVTAIGGVGPPGPANVITIGDVDTLETGEAATASLTGTAPTQVLNLGLPKGNTGTAATIAVGDVTTLPPGEDATVTNSGTPGAAVFDFEIPAGAAATIAVGDVATGAPGTPAEVENVGTSSVAIFDFTIPKGDQGEKGWSPQFAIEPDGARRVLRVTGWAGGEGTSPAIGDYVGATGLVPAIGDAIDIRGPEGSSSGLDDGDKGDIIVSDSGAVWTIEDGAIAPENLDPAAGEHGAILYRGAVQWSVLPAGQAGQVLASGGAAADPSWAGPHISLPGGRLTLASGNSITISDVVAATTVYYTPHVSGALPLYDGTTMITRAFSEMSLPLDSNSGHTGYHQSGKGFSFFAFDNSGTLDIGTGPAWVSDTSVGTGAGTSEVELYNGVWVNKNTITLRFGTASGDTVSAPARRATFLGAAYMTANGQTEDSVLNRYVSNAYNVTDRTLRVIEPADSWSYNADAWRPFNNNAANIARTFHCVPRFVMLQAMGHFLCSPAGAGSIGIGVDTGTSSASNSLIARGFCNGTQLVVSSSVYADSPGLGRHGFAMMERGSGSGTQTWYGDAGAADALQSGMVGSTTN